MDDFKIVKEKRIFEGAKILVKHDTVILPNGRKVMDVLLSAAALIKL